MNMDAFNAFIEVDEGTHDEGDHQLNSIVQNRQPNTTPQQFEKIFAFVTDHNEGHIDKETFNTMWEHLAAELNDIGPPDHTSAEWKKIWSAYKKRKFLVNNVSLEASDKPFIHPIGVGDDTSKKVEFYSDISEKLSVLIEKQNVLIAQQDVIIQKLDISNSLMQVIAKKA